MENILPFVKAQFAISQTGVSISWMVVAVISLLFIGKSKIKTKKN